ncbi:sulfotransferase family 2 domain-containing protein [Desulfosediminicola sp.]|uniref:sulfotransferase family 2 domain-containing protein n=1 Tax=Desulfosediminicola sp. TaxID=2886825 RepID=UPI003AF2BA46
MTQRQLFWLHIKKSAGITTRSLLQPHYVEVDRVKKPKTFIQASPEEYNDILNNYRVVLGEYQFKRCLFAKKYLYPENWDDIFSFAFSREPTDRCVSMFYYLYWRDSGHIKNIARFLKYFIASKKLMSNTSYAFDVFLDCVHEARMSDSIYRPLGNHFTTHTAPMWDDITDFSGNVLLKEVYRLENLTEGINRAFEECGIAKRLNSGGEVLNKTKRRKTYNPNQSQKKKIEEIYCNDFEIYEKAWH